MALAVPAPGLAPDALARFERKPRRGSREAMLLPYIWQRGNTLFLLDRAFNGDWAIAELQFDGLSGCYHECERMFYEWPREAIGALLARVLVHGEPATLEAAATLDAWWGHVSAVS